MGSRITIGFTLFVVGFAATASVYLQRRDVIVDFERGFEGGLIEEFNNRERTGDDYFRWTKAASYLDLHHLPTSGELAVEASIRVRRPHGEPLPNLAFTANDETVYRTAGLPSTVTYRFAFPASRSRVRLGIRSDTFDPSGERPLGVQVLNVTVRLGEARPSWIEPALWMGTAAVVLFVASLSCGIGPFWGGVSSLSFVLMFAYLLAQHAVRFSSYPREVTALAAATLLVVFLARRLQDDRRPWVLAAVAAVFLLEMGVAFYPLTLSSDAHFQANRMRDVLEGDWHPTSVTQHDPPFDIPYPISLYVVATPLAKLGLDRVTALITVTSLFDVLVSILLIVLALRYLDDIRAGILAALLYQLVAVNPLTFSAGNFTNLFAVSMATLSFFYLFSSPVRCTVFAFVAITAHFGMLLEGMILWPAWIALVWLSPVPLEDDRKRLTLALAASFFLAGLYYLGYWELFTSQWGRAVSGGTGGAPSGVASVISQLGWVFLVVAVLGSLTFLRRPGTSRFHGAAAIWLGATALFYVVDLFSALEIRYILQALPVLALSAGVYLSEAFDRSRLGKIAASAAILYIVVMGLGTLHDVALVRYHFP